MTEWISIKDRLPESNTDVLLFSEHGITIAFLSNSYWYDYNQNDYNDPLYWMPLPEPPR